MTTIVLIVGNLGGDPEVRFSPSGTKITTFTVASNSKRQGKDETIWYKAVAFGEHLDKMISFLKKGSSVMVSGSLHQNKWQDKEGREQTTLEVICDNIRFTPTARPAEPGQPQTQRAPNSYAQQSPQHAQVQQPAYSAPTYAAPAYTPPPQAQSQPFEMHDFSFGGTPDAQNGNYEDTPF